MRDRWTSKKYLKCAAERERKGTRGSQKFEQFRKSFTDAFARQASVHARHPLDFAETYQIVLDRTRLLIGEGDVARDTQTQWTVATVDQPRPEIHGANRFLQLIPFDRFDTIYPGIPSNVQTVVTALSGDDLDEFASEAATRGVCRFPRPGEGNHFESPWDGVPIVSRLSRWVLRTDPAGD